MFQPVAALPGRPLRAAVLDDWSLPQIADDPVTGGLPGRPPGPAPGGAVSCGGAGNPARSVT